MPVPTLKKEFLDHFGLFQVFL